MNSLSPIQRQIIEERFIEDNPDTLKVVGERIGITKERVRQIQAKALQILREALAKLDR